MEKSGTAFDRAPKFAELSGAPGRRYVLASEAVFSASGAQIANRYRIADEAQPFECGFATA